MIISTIRSGALGSVDVFLFLIVDRGLVIRVVVVVVVVVVA